MIGRTGRTGDERGLTLIEFAMASAVAGVMFLVLYSALSQALDAYDVGQLRSRAVQQGRVVMVRIVDDIKYSEDIWVADDNRVFISRPHEEDGEFESIDYLYNSGNDTLYRRIYGQPWYEFAEQVTSFSLVYRDLYRTQIATPVADMNQIKYIEVELILQEDTFEFALRNLVVLENSVAVPWP